jgi:hypothetical protein
MLISEADIGDEVSWTNSKSGFIESFVIVGKCIDFYWDGNLIGDVFIQLNGPTQSGWRGMAFVKCEKCSLVKSNQSQISSSTCICPMPLLMQSGCKCGAFCASP